MPTYFTFRSLVSFPSVFELLAEEYLGGKYRDQVLAVLVAKHFFYLKNVAALGPQFTRTMTSKWPPVFTIPKQTIRVAGVQKGADLVRLPKEAKQDGRVTHLWVFVFETGKPAAELYTAKAEVIAESFREEGEALVFPVEAFSAAHEAA